MVSSGLINSQIDTRPETCRNISRIDLLNVILENSRKFSRLDIGYYKCILSILEIFVQVPGCARSIVNWILSVKQC